jgi:Zn-dependent peptidase ImmA (M78 family)/transcriptional regulator with XRE-family HTH domain
MDVLGSIKKIGARLRLARESAGYSTRTAAKKLQDAGHAITYATLSNYETGKTAPSIAMLEALAGLYERSRDWFYSTGPSFEGVKYRCLKAVRVSDKRNFEGEALQWLTAYLAAESRVNDPLKAPKDFAIKPAESGKVVARKIRTEYKFESFPIPSVVRLVENFGIRVVQVASDARIDGFAAMLGTTPCVVINSSLSHDRIRMNLAHELAHHLFSDCVDGASLSEAEIEKRAMDCGSHLLIPDEALADAFALKSMVRLVQYKERYGVSLAAMIYRAKPLKLITDREYEMLWMEFSRLGWRKEEPGYVSPDRPLRMEALFDAAVRQGKMTYAEISTIAGLDERVVRQRVMAALGGVVESVDAHRESNPMRIDRYRDEQNEAKEF